MYFDLSIKKKHQFVKKKKKKKNSDPTAKMVKIVAVADTHDAHVPIGDLSA